MVGGSSAVVVGGDRAFARVSIDGRFRRTAERRS
jgi:hypothetical protein